MRTYYVNDPQVVFWKLNGFSCNSTLKKTIIFPSVLSSISFSFIHMRRMNRTGDSFAWMVKLSEHSVMIQVKNKLKLKARVFLFISLWCLFFRSLFYLRFQFRYNERKIIFKILLSMSLIGFYEVLLLISPLLVYVAGVCILIICM